MPQIKIVCKEELGFPTAAVEPKASGGGVLTTVNICFQYIMKVCLGFFA